LTLDSATLATLAGNLTKNGPGTMVINSKNPLFGNVTDCTSLTRFTDIGLASLSQMSNLKKLNLQSTGATKAGVEMFRRMLPDCEVFFFQPTGANGGAYEE